jgi:hypothetical protein
MSVVQYLLQALPEALFQHNLATLDRSRWQAEQRMDSIHFWVDRHFSKDWHKFVAHGATIRRSSRHAHNVAVTEQPSFSSCFSTPFM